MAAEFSKGGFFDGVDLIVPIPLHALRRLQRQYNQS
jgi:predicted amidophosphoribosyltransferase